MKENNLFRKVKERYEIYFYKREDVPDFARGHYDVCEDGILMPYCEVNKMYIMIRKKD